MGLDSVELVMRVEEAFEIAIDDAEAPGLVTVGLLHDYVVTALRDRGESVNPDKIFDQLRALIIVQLGISPELVVKNARFIQDLKLD